MIKKEPHTGCGKAQEMNRERGVLLRANICIIIELPFLKKIFLVQKIIESKKKMKSDLAFPLLYIIY